MSPAPGDRPAADGTRVNDVRANSRAAIAAFDAIGGYARAEALPLEALPPISQPSPAQDHARLARTLGALRHLADEFGWLIFGDVLRAATEQYKLLGTGYARPATALNARLADEAIGACDRGITAPRWHRVDPWPPDTLFCLHAHASSRGLDFESAVADLTTRLLADLQHYADHQGISFQEALVAGTRAHAQQRLRAEGPFETGCEPDQVPTTASFHPVATNQGVVVSPGDAEWLLIRTAARTQERWEHGFPPDQWDSDDQRVLTAALAEARGQAPLDIYRDLRPQVAARVTQIEDGPTTAAELGREHGRAGTVPHCDLEIDGDAAALLQALGETEWMTDANYPYRLSLVIAYAGAYQAAARGPAPADFPARIAARDFPRTNPTGVTPSTPDPGHRSRGGSPPPRPGPRPGA